MASRAFYIFSNVLCYIYCVKHVSSHDFNGVLFCSIEVSLIYKRFAIIVPTDEKLVNYLSYYKCCAPVLSFLDTPDLTKFLFFFTAIGYLAISVWSHKYLGALISFCLRNFKVTAEQVLFYSQVQIHKIRVLFCCI